MYRFKYFYLYDKEGLGNFLSDTPQGLVEAFKGFMNKDEYDDFVNTNPTPQQILKKALMLYKNILPDEYYKIGIINNETNEIIDTMDVRNAHLVYRYKFYYNDGSTELSGARSSNPNNLWFDFDGLMDWDEYDKLLEKNLTTKEILEMAMKVYRTVYKDYYRIEIVNDETNEIIDYIDESEVKKNV